MPTEESSRRDVGIESGAAVDRPSDVDHSKKNSTLWIVIASLACVGIFGASLVGGLVSGDPNNVFFIIIVVFASLAIGVAGTIAFTNSMNSGHGNRTLEHKRSDIRKTFTNNSDEEQNDNGQYPDRYMPQSTTPHIKEISAVSVVGEMSALSPHSYEEFSTRREDPSDGRTPKRRKSFENRTPRQKAANRSRKGPFDFSSIASSRKGRRARREDPPEENPPPTSRSYHIQQKDPTGPKVASNGHLIEDEGPSVHTRTSTFSRQVEISYDGSRTPTEHNRDVREGDIHSLVKIQSVKNSSTAPREPSIHNHNDPDGLEAQIDEMSPKSSKQLPPPPPPPPPPQTRRESFNKRRPPSTRSEASRPKSPISEVGSTVSSIFLKPFNAVFGRRKEASEASFSEASSYIKGSEAGFSGYNKASDRSNQGSSPSRTVERREKGEKSERRDEVKEREKHDEASIEIEERDRYEEREETRDVAAKEVGDLTDGANGYVEDGPGGQGKPPRFDNRAYEESGRITPSSERDGLSTIAGSHTTKAATRRRSSGRSDRDDRYQSADAQSSAGGSTIAPTEIKSTAGSSIFSGAASSTFDPQARNRALKKIEANTFSLGAQPILEESSKYYDEESSVGGDFNRPGIYDVFAPPGPIGLVVDTRKEGPIVHSLKKTSPMIGLINPGDLIIALDDRDVRKMNAASLTRLMAKKSKQPERKFTLMPLVDY